MSLNLIRQIESAAAKALHSRKGRENWPEGAQQEQLQVGSEEKAEYWSCQQETFGFSRSPIPLKKPRRIFSSTNMMNNSYQFSIELLYILDI